MIRPPLRIGLTGGIGSGKSTAAALLHDLGAYGVDTDAISRELTGLNGAALPALQDAFGPQALVLDPHTGAGPILNRAWMRQQVFADPALRQRLEAILHPMIREHTEAAYAAAAASSACRAVVFDVPLLVESGTWLQRVDQVWVVDCPVDVQVRRVQARSGWDEATVRAVIAQQATRSQRLAVAQVVLDNSTDDLPALRTQIEAAWRGCQPQERSAG